MVAYHTLSKDDLIRACERKDRNIRRLDAALLAMKSRVDLAESRVARQEKQLRRLWHLAGLLDAYPSGD